MFQWSSLNFEVRFLLLIKLLLSTYNWLTKVGLLDFNLIIPYPSGSLMENLIHLKQVNHFSTGTSPLLKICFSSFYRRCSRECKYRHKSISLRNSHCCHEVFFNHLMYLTVNYFPWFLFDIDINQLCMICRHFCLQSPWP